MSYVGVILDLGLGGLFCGPQSTGIYGPAATSVESGTELNLRSIAFHDCVITVVYKPPSFCEI